MTENTPHFIARIRVKYKFFREDSEETDLLATLAYCDHGNLVIMWFADTSSSADPYRTLTIPCHQLLFWDIEDKQ
jgi:hypothetical protein